MLPLLLCPTIGSYLWLQKFGSSVLDLNGSYIRNKWHPSEDLRIGTGCGAVWDPFVDLEAGHSLAERCLLLGGFRLDF
jgi:hypothetical protein